MFSFYRLSETTKVLFGQQRENPVFAMLVICEINVKGIL